MHSKNSNLTNGITAAQYGIHVDYVYVYYWASPRVYYYALHAINYAWAISQYYIPCFQRDRLCIINSAYINNTRKHGRPGTEATMFSARSPTHN